MRPQATRLGKAVGGVLALLLLTSCAGLRPGVAAEVGDEKVSTRQLDSFARSFCAFRATQQPGDQPSKQTRTQALTIMVISRLAEQHADDTDFKVNQSQLEQTMTQLDDITAKLPDDDRDTFTEEVRRSLAGDQTLSQEVSRVLAEQGQTSPDDAAVAQAQQQVLDEWTDTYDVDLDPRFGTWQDGSVNGSGGSLSVRVSTPNNGIPGDPTSGLLASQTCR